MLKDDHYIPPPDTQSHGGGSSQGQQYDSNGYPIGIQTSPYGNGNDPNNDPLNGYYSQDPYSNGNFGGGGNAGGGGGGGGVPLGGTKAATGLATTAGTTAAATYAGMTIPQWLQTALGVYGAYRSSQPGRFQQIPEDPSQTAARQKLLGFVDNSPTRDMLGNLISQRLGAAHGFQLPPGANGYNPTPAGNAGGYDLSKILPTLMGHGMAPSGAPSGAPTTAAPDPNAVNQWLSEHPEVLRMGSSVAAGSVAQVFGLSQQQASQMIITYLQSQGAPPSASTSGLEVMAP